MGEIDGGFYRHSVTWTKFGGAKVTVSLELTGPVHPRDGRRLAKKYAMEAGWARPRWWQWWRWRDDRDPFGPH